MNKTCLEWISSCMWKIYYFAWYYYLHLK